MVLRPVINPEDGEKFYPEEFVGIKDMESGVACYIRVAGKNEIGGSVKEDIRDAYVEIRNDLGMQMEKIKVPERGKFTLNLENRNWHPGLYLCTLVADGARVGTTKIMIKP
jgi:predicted  nucleic acid-binding Zn-ribbon protein